MMMMQGHNNMGGFYFMNPLQTTQWEWDETAFSTLILFFFNVFDFLAKRMRFLEGRSHLLR
jgi:hypothetical protein